MSILDRTETPAGVTNLTRWIPRLIAGTAAIHLAFGAVNGAGDLSGMLSDGLVNSVGGDPERESALWFLLTGVAWTGLAGLSRYSVEYTGRLPKIVGACLLATAVPLTVVEPASGGWLVGAIGVAALVAARIPREA